MSKKQEEKVTPGNIVLDLRTRMTSLNGEDVIWKVPGEPDAEGKPTEPVEQPETEQANLGVCLIECLGAFKPPSKELTKVMVTHRLQTNIFQHLEDDKPFEVGQFAKGILQDSWRQHMECPTRRLPNAFMAQTGLAIGLKMEKSDVDMTGID